MKDNFSTRSADYAKYRPTYPTALYNYLLTLVPGTQLAWDCGTGNGQVAYQLASNFDKVVATDISAQQIANAMLKSNILYSIQPAEKTQFPNHHFDLITVAQAIHWFDFTAFYEEVARTLKAKGIIAVIGYNRPQISPNVDALITSFYQNVLGPFWDLERKYIDDNYATIPFPFHEIKPPQFENVVQWTFKQLIGYLETWSAVKHFANKIGYNPIDDIYSQLKAGWGEKNSKPVKFCILLRIGRL